MCIWPRLRTSFGEPEDYDQCRIDRVSCEELRKVSTFTEAPRGTSILCGCIADTYRHFPGAYRAKRIFLTYM
jgi:hypothetical protein